MKGRPLAKAGYEQELTSIKGFVALQNRADSGGASVASDKVGHAYSVWYMYITRCTLCNESTAGADASVETPNLYYCVKYCLYFFRVIHYHASTRYVY